MQTHMQSHQKTLRLPHVHPHRYLQTWRHTCLLNMCIHVLAPDTHSWSAHSCTYTHIQYTFVCTHTHTEHTFICTHAHTCPVYSYVHMQTPNTHAIYMCTCMHSTWDTHVPVRHIDTCMCMEHMLMFVHMAHM